MKDSNSITVCDTYEDAIELVDEMGGTGKVIKLDNGKFKVIYIGGVK